MRAKHLETALDYHAVYTWTTQCSHEVRQNHAHHCVLCLAYLTRRREHVKPRAVLTIACSGVRLAATIELAYELRQPRRQARSRGLLSSRTETGEVGGGSAGRDVSSHDCHTGQPQFLS